MSGAMAGSRVLVTGATGFIGGVLTRALVERGAEVSVLVREGTATGALGDSVSIIEHPGSATALAGELGSMGIQTVFHLATCFRGVHVPEDIEPLVDANVLFGTQLAEAVSGLGIERFINTGTAWQRDSHGAYSPAALYAATKQAMEDILRFYAEAGSFPVIDLKLFDCYGPGDPRLKLVPLLVRAARSGEALELSEGEQLIDLTHVSDVVSALLRAAEAEGGAWSSYAVGSGQPMTVRSLVGAVEKAAGTSIDVRWGARPYRLREMFEPFAAGDPIPGWQPQISLDAGLREMIGASS